MDTDKQKNIFTGTIMFFSGAVIGTLMHLLFSHLLIRYDISSHMGLGLIGTIQIFIITCTISWTDSKVADMGLFVLGLLSAQDIIIQQLLVTESKDREDEKSKQK